MRMIQWAVAVLVIAATTVPQDAASQSMAERLRRRAEEAAKKKAEEAAKGGAADSTRIKAAADSAKAKAAADSAKAAAAPAAAPAASGATPAAASGAAAAPADVVWVNYDFQPGTRPLFVDDFSADVVGNFPKRLEFARGNMEVAEWNGKRFLRTTTYDSRFTLNLPEVLPERFTVEFDATPSRNRGGSPVPAYFALSTDAVSQVSFREWEKKGTGGIVGTGPKAEGETRLALGSNPFRVRLMADGKYAKVYINETRVANVPNAELGRSNKLIFSVPGEEAHPTYIGNFSVMAGGRRLYDDLAEKGRVATQGIYFDTGSDVIKPESAPTLKEIAAMLKEHADLLLVIEGHTDNVGNAAANQALSEKRAAAVREALISQHSIDGGRLTAKGFGATKPSGPNTTPEGRQTNRRVELVKA